MGIPFHTVWTKAQPSLELLPEGHLSSPGLMTETIQQITLWQPQIHQGSTGAAGQRAGEQGGWAGQARPNQVTTNSWGRK